MTQEKPAFFELPDSSKITGTVQKPYVYNSIIIWCVDKMKKYKHDFIENYDGFMGFGWDRETDEKTVICYLQMFSDDMVADRITKRMSDDELAEVHNLINRLLITHFKEEEYHGLILKDDNHE